MRRVAAIALACSSFACSLDWSFPSESVGGAGGQAGAGGLGGSGGVGGAMAACGNGLIEQGEECDDENDITDDGCNRCQVECQGAHSVEDPRTHHCYVRREDADPWIPSATACETNGGYLAVVRDAEEAALVAGLIGDSTNAWLGGRRPGDGDFTWITGEAFDFDNWASGIPGVGLDCVVTRNDGKFYGEMCTETFIGICEVDPAGQLAD
jgi:cysteine-rich repeat protein